MMSLIEISESVPMRKQTQDCTKLIYENGHTDSAMAICRTVDSNPVPCPNGIDNCFLNVFRADQISLEIVHIFADNGF